MGAETREQPVQEPLFCAWKDEYSIGVDKIDAQHAHLLDMINGMYSDMKNGLSQKRLFEILKNMVQYAKEHFADEERIMEECGYPGLPDQREAHRAFAQETRVFLMQFKAGKEIDRELFVFLKNWLVTHITKADKQIGLFIASQQ